MTTHRAKLWSIVAIAAVVYVAAVAASGAQYCGPPQGRYWHSWLMTQYRCQGPPSPRQWHWRQQYRGWRGDNYRAWWR
jgi:hypothetical protein